MIKILHHLGFVVRSIATFEKSMIFQKKIREIIDPVQNARLALYTNYDNSYIELIEPLGHEAFTWNALNKYGNHFNHFCYEVSGIQNIESIVSKYRLIHVLGPVKAVLFDDRQVVFYFTRNKQIVEFLI